MKSSIDMKAISIVEDLAGLDSATAIQILSLAIGEIAQQVNTDAGALKHIVKGHGPKIIPSPVFTSKIDKDHEIKTFIDNYPNPTTQTDLLRTLISTFGKKRSPSRSGLGRYLQKRHLVTHNKTFEKDTDEQ